MAIRGNLSHFRCLACRVVEFNYKSPFNTGCQKWPFQVLFRCLRPLNRGVRLIKVSFKVNKGNKFWDFGYCPLNRGCPLNTGFTVFTFWAGDGLLFSCKIFWDLIRAVAILFCTKFTDFSDNIDLQELFRHFGLFGLGLCNGWLQKVSPP